MYTIHSNPYNVHYTQYTVTHIMYAIHSNPYNVHYTLHTVTRIMYTIHYTQYSVTQNSGFFNERSFVRPSDYICVRLTKGIFTVVQLWAVECWRVEFGLQKLWCVVWHTDSMINILICRFVNSKKGKLTNILYTQVLSNPVDINRNCLSVCHGAISSCH